MGVNVTWRRVIVTLAATALVAMAIVLLGRRWPITDAAMRDRVVAHLAEATGFTIQADGPMMLRLLPRPQLEIRDVAIRGLADAVSLDAEALKGRLELLPLLLGRLRIGAAQFEGPTAVVDTDRLRPLLREVLAHPLSPAVRRRLFTSGVIVHNGVLRLRSADPSRDAVLTDLSGALVWPSDEAELRLDANGTWHGAPTELDLNVDQPGAVMAGGSSIASVKLRSALFEMGGEGMLFGAGEVRASGKVVASTTDLPAVLRSLAKPLPADVRVSEARLGGDATLVADALSLDHLALSLDDVSFDGAAVLRRQEGRTMLAGTLATDHIDLGRFLGVLPPLVGGNGAWSTAPLGPALAALDAMDLRLSMEHATLGGVQAEDGSLSSQSSGNRMELSLGEVRAYDGLLKGRVIATVAENRIDLRADATASRLDLARLARDLPGVSGAMGSFTGHVAVESQGECVADIMANMSGRGQVDLRGGEIGGDLAAEVVSAGAAGPGRDVDVGTGTGIFDDAVLNFALSHGTWRLGDSWVAWPGSRAVLTGTASLPAQTVAVTARLDPGRGGTGADYTIFGSWRALRLGSAPAPF